MPLIEGPSSKLPDFRAGFVVVAAGSKGIVSLGVGARLTWGERVFGGYNAFYYVDIGVKTFAKTFKCSSKDIAIDFDVTVLLNFKIKDPARAVEQGMSDQDALLVTPINRAVAEIVSNYNVSQAAEAKRAVDLALKTLKTDQAIEIVDVSTDLKADAAALALLRTIAEEDIAKKANAASARVTEERRKEIVTLLDFPNQLLAQSMVTKDPAFRDALNYKLTELNDDRQRQIDLLKTLIDAKIIEPHDFHDNYGPLIEAALAAIRGPVITPPVPAAASIAGPTIDQPKK